MIDPRKEFSRWYDAMTAPYVKAANDMAWMAVYVAIAAMAAWRT